MWDGNEVWLIVAGGATFAAFPGWYATLFSGFYLALFLILVALIVRGVAFEFWGKDDRPRWRATLGVGDGRLELWPRRAAVGRRLGEHRRAACRSTPSQEFTGTLFTLLNPYALLGGVTTLLLFLAHGAIFLTCAPRGELDERARAIARCAVARGRRRRHRVPRLDGRRHGDRTGVEVAVVVLAGVGAVLLARSAAAELAQRAARLGVRAAARPRSSRCSCTLFVDLFPHAMPSSTDAALRPDARERRRPRPTR